MNNRFDKTFNNVDSLTSRPFSYGHPDGVWITSIFFCLPIFASIVGVLVTLVMFVLKGSFDPVAIIGLVVTSVLFLPLIILMFKRSDKSIYVAVFLTFLAIVGATLAHGQKQVAFYVLLGVSAASVYLVYYLFGLKSDGLIK